MSQPLAESAAQPRRAAAAACSSRSFGGFPTSSSYLVSQVARSTGLDERLDYRHGSALAMPFEDATFDAAYTQGMGMHVADKLALYRALPDYALPRLAGPSGPLASSGS